MGSHVVNRIDTCVTVDLLESHGSNRDSSKRSLAQLDTCTITVQYRYYYPGSQLNAILKYWLQELRMNYVALAIALG